MRTVEYAVVEDAPAARGAYSQAVRAGMVVDGMKVEVDCVAYVPAR